MDFAVPPSGAVISYKFSSANIGTLPRQGGGNPTAAQIAPTGSVTNTPATANFSAALGGAVASIDTVVPSSPGGTTYSQLVELDSPSSQSQYAYVGVSASCTPVVGGLGLQESVTPSVFSDVGEDLTFTFTVTNTGAFPLNNVEAQSGVAALGTCAPIALPGTLAPGASTTCSARYTVAATDMAGGCIANPVTASGTTSTGSTAAGSATAESCLSSDKTRRAIGKFISHRADLLASNDPDSTSGLRRFATAGGGSAQPITAAANGDARNGSVVVASSLSQMIASAWTSGDAQRMALGAGSDTVGDAVRAADPVQVKT